MPLQLSADENLVDKLKEAYSESLAEAAAKAAGLLNKQGLATELNCSVRTIDNLVWRRAIPYLKIGRLIRFRLEDVRRALRNRYTIREVSI